jgi:hypothetical protein
VTPPTVSPHLLRGPHVALRKKDPDIDERRSGGRDVVATVRARVAQLIWLVCVVCALLLALGALLIALDANGDNDLVAFVLDAADAVDLGVFSREDGIKQFRGQDADVKNALFNWGLGAIAWLVVGRILDRLVRP